MRTTHVVVLPYDPKWKEDFSAIRAELEAAMWKECRQSPALM